MNYRRLVLVASGTLLLVGGTECRGQYEFLGIHPEAALQATTLGQSLHTLHAVAERVFVGYGDLAINTGPISVRFYDPTVEAFSASLGISNTEAIHRFRNVGSQVFALTSDPLNMDPGGYYAGPVDDPDSWSAMESLPFLHVYDLASVAGDQPKLYLSGSGGPTSNYHSVVYESDDGGTTWQLSLDAGLPDGVTGGNSNFSRFYGAAELNGQVYVQQVLFRPGMVEPLAMYRNEGQGWTELPPPRTATGVWTRFLDPEAFLDSVIVRDQHPGQASQIFQFDGTELREIQPAGASSQLEFLDQFVANDTLYLLTDDQRVIATSDLLEWRTIVEQVPSTFLSLAVIDNDIYFGTSESSLYRYAMSVPEPAEAAAVASCLAICLAALRNGKR